MIIDPSGTSHRETNICFIFQWNVPPDLNRYFMDWSKNYLFHFWFSNVSNARCSFICFIQKLSQNFETINWQWIINHNSDISCSTSPNIWNSLIGSAAASRVLIGCHQILIFHDEKGSRSCHAEAWIRFLEDIDYWWIFYALTFHQFVQLENWRIFFGKYICTYCPLVIFRLNDLSIQHKYYKW